ncbi:S8 family peptidase [Bacillus safensis]|uniref:S8 family peptidase n=1 Tax=Bacillus safensis TaxID=561879 RepID=UPI0018E10ED0|nr:S8 family peptidase [Bacillus safensis]MBI1630299.1 S8 family serine peptidase [Bacillus safensis]
MPEDKNVDYHKKIIIKLKPEIDTSKEEKKILLIHQSINSASSISDHAPPNNLMQPLFSSPPLREELNRSLTTENLESEVNLTSYYFIDVFEDINTNEFIKRLSELDSVEVAYVAGPPTPPPIVNESDDPYSASQGYLYAAPDGINAKYAWQFPGGDGSGITIIDIEQGWNLKHEDLISKNIELIHGVNHTYHEHGTSVLGELAAVDNNIGAVGICPNATVKVASEWETSDVKDYSTAKAIESAIQVLGRGDVILLEAQTKVPHVEGYLPVEVEPAIFDVIRLATSRGIIVVEAAGNGLNDLDNYVDFNGKKSLNRNSPDFKDSGAIMVAAAEAASPHHRKSFSNYGTRIDCYAWGEKVTSTSGKEGLNSYTYDFNGTSSASPIIAGAVVIAQGLNKARFGDVYGASQLRTLLVAHNLNTSSIPGEKIGYMPDLKAITNYILS